MGLQDAALSSIEAWRSPPLSCGEGHKGRRVSQAEEQHCIRFEPVDFSRDAWVDVAEKTSGRGALSQVADKARLVALQEVHIPSELGAEPWIEARLQAMAREEY